MAEFLSRAGNLVVRAERQAAPYPLQRKFVIWGMWAGCFGGLLFVSPLAGLSFLVLFGAMGALWPRAEPPVLAFCIMLQWLSVMSGYFYYLAQGHYPGESGGSFVGNLEGAVLLSLIGLVALTAGLRTGLKLFQGRFEWAQQKLQASIPCYDVRALFWCVIVLFAINWRVEILPMEIFPRGAQIIYNILAFREVLLFLLFLEILQQQKGYCYGVAAFVYVLIPAFTSIGAGFKGLFVLLCIALLSEWRPWSKSLLDRRRSSRAVRAAAVAVTVLLVMGLIYVGTVKSVWRVAVMTGTAGDSPMEKVNTYFTILREGVAEQAEWSSVLGSTALEGLASGLSAGLDYFAIVLERVPEVVPHANGELTLRTLIHLITPRIVFPDKADLVSSSWLIRKYAGIWAAGDEEGTSVALGYMAEFYIDFGVPGMFVLIFLYGLGAGMAYGAMLLFAPSYNFFRSAVTVSFLQHFVGYGGEIPKIIGGLVENSLIFGLLLYLVGPWLHRMLLVRSERAAPRKQHLVTSRVGETS